MKNLIYLLMILGLVACGGGGDGGGGGGESDETTAQEEVLPDPPTGCSTDPDLVGTWTSWPLASRGTLQIEEACVLRSPGTCDQVIYLNQTASEENESMLITVNVVKANAVQGCLQKGVYLCTYKWYYAYQGSSTIRMELLCPGHTNLMTYEKF